MLTPMFAPHIGGVENHVKKISNLLIKKGHVINIITMKYNPSIPSSEVLDNINIHRFSGNRLIKIWLWIYKNKNLIKNSDLIHCHDFVSFIYWYFPFRLLYPFKSVYITFHGYEGVPILKKVILMRKLTEFLTVGNICIGDFIPKWYGTKANFISYGGVELIPTEVNTNSEGAVFIGRLEKDTGIMTYIDSIKIMKDKYQINFEVGICGDGSLQETIKKLVKENQLKIKLYGFVENPTDYLVNYKFAFVSGYLAILEAMINKKLVFSVYDNELKRDYLTSIPNFKSIMIIASSPEDLANKILYFRENPERAEEIIDNAYRFAKHQTWEKVVDKYLELWKFKNE